jgi:hypothetical protein
MSQFQQPTWSGQPVPPSPQPRKKNRPLAIVAIVGGILVVICALCSFAAYVGSTIHNTTIAATPTATTVPKQAVLLATNVPTEISTDAPTDTPTTLATTAPTPTPTLQPSPTPLPTHAPQPTPRPTPPPPKPTPTQCSQPCNPWGYNFSPGKLIYYPPSNFCAYFNCIPSFWGSDDPGDGFVNQCVDGTYSQSGGERGDCSDHGGEGRPLYSH